jgi:hypothetical protein
MAFSESGVGSLSTCWIASIFSMVIFYGARLSKSLVKETRSKERHSDDLRRPSTKRESMFLSTRLSARHYPESQYDRVGRAPRSMVFSLLVVKRTLGGGYEV